MDRAAEKPEDRRLYHASPAGEACGKVGAPHQMLLLHCLLFTTIHNIPLKNSRKSFQNLEGLQILDGLPFPFWKGFLLVFVCHPSFCLSLSDKP
jgi:hypothetical protein